MLAAVLFDMDGTLVDTEKVWEVALHELVARHGGRLSPETRRAMIGASSGTTMRLIAEEVADPGLDLEVGAAWLDARVTELFRAGLLWRPGAQELLAAVRAAGIPTALVTNTRRALADVAMLTLDPANFDAVVCGDEVSAPKPDPAHYREAALTLGVEPGHCVAVEDSPIGIASAVAAGCAVLGVPNEVPLDGLPITVRTSLLDVDLPLLRSLTSARTPVPAA